MTTKFGVGIIFKKAQLSAKFHCPASTVTLFSEDGAVIESNSSPVIESQSTSWLWWNYSLQLSMLHQMPMLDAKGLLFQ